MLVIFSADVLTKLLVSFYIASALSLAQFLHSWYVKNDPIYKGKMGIGLSFFHGHTANYTFGYLAAGLLFICVFLVTFSTFSVMPLLKTLTLESFLWKYGVWIGLQLVAFYILADMVGPSASKLIQNALALFMAFMILSACTEDVDLQQVLANWQNSWPIYAAPIGWGMYWVTAFQRDRMKHEKRRLQESSKTDSMDIKTVSRESELEDLIVYRVPVIYYFAVVFWDIFLGFGLSLGCYFLSHHY
jgi:hypothetical protein